MAQDLFDSENAQKAENCENNNSFWIISLLSDAFGIQKRSILGSEKTRKAENCENNNSFWIISLLSDAFGIK
jgi:hypothetical protein